MPVPSVITDLSTTAASNFPAGSDAPSTIDDTLRAHGAFIKQIYDGPLIPAYGSAGAPAYGFTSDPNTGWYGEGSDVLSAATGGTKRVSIGAPGASTPAIKAFATPSVDSAFSAYLGQDGSNNTRVQLSHNDSDGLSIIDFTGSVFAKGRISRGGTAVLDISATRNVTIAAPASGVAVSITGVTGANALVVSGGPIRTTSLLVADLLSPATAGAGARAFATDATGTTFGSVPVGGGSNGVPVYCDGTDWRIG
jgi:hypothetical protein